jgi:hypothetical protein
MNNQYIVAVELWKDGKALEWKQMAVESPIDVKATDFVDYIQGEFESDGFTVKIVDIFKL